MAHVTTNKIKYYIEVRERNSNNWMYLYKIETACLKEKHNQALVMKNCIYAYISIKYYNL